VSGKTQLCSRDPRVQGSPQRLLFGTVYMLLSMIPLLSLVSQIELLHPSGVYHSFGRDFTKSCHETHLGIAQMRVGQRERLSRCGRILELPFISVALQIRSKGSGSSDRARVSRRPSIYLRSLLVEKRTHFHHGALSWRHFKTCSAHRVAFCKVP